MLNTTLVGVFFCIALLTVAVAQFKAAMLPGDAPELSHPRSYHSMAWESVLYINSPKSGDAMASLCAVVILGGRNPLVVEFTSNTAVVAGVLVPIPTASLAASTESVVPSTLKPSVLEELMVSFLSAALMEVSVARAPLPL